MSHSRTGTTSGPSACTKATGMDGGACLAEALARGALEPMRASVWQQNDDSTNKMERPTSQVRPPGRRERPKLDAFVHFCCPRTEPTRWHVRHSDEAILSWENTRIKSKSHINVDIKSNFKHEIRTMGGSILGRGVAKEMCLQFGCLPNFWCWLTLPDSTGMDPKMATAGRPAVWTLLLRS